MNTNTIEITSASARKVSDAILGIGPKVSKETYDAHVPQFVSKTGEIVRMDKAAPIEITTYSILDVSAAILGTGPRVDRDTYDAHVPQFVSKTGEIVRMDKAREELGQLKARLRPIKARIA